MEAVDELNAECCANQSDSETNPACDDLGEWEDE
jgi:hypothetical protein